MASACKKNQSTNDCTDRLSNLPDCLIHRILSFLPTKDAVLTSVLSKRWINMWTFISHLHFDESDFIRPNKTNNFVNFVNRVLLLSNSTLQSFTLVSSDANVTLPCNIYTWIAAVLNRQVQKVHIDYGASLLFSSRSLFQCRFLVDLKLKFQRGFLIFPAYVFLPNLKFLSLSQTRLLRDSLARNHPKELTLNFPALRVFKAELCLWCWLNVCLQVPMLEVFSVAKMEVYSAIKICTSCPKIFSFKIKQDDQIFQHIVLSDPSSASKATLEISGSVKFGPRVCMLLRQFNQVRYLKLGDIQKTLLSSEEDFASLPQLSNVRRLKIGKVSGDNLLGLLYKLPTLQTLVLNSGLLEFDKKVLDSASLPHCVESSLKEVKFGVLSGKEHELCLAKFLMESGAVLEQMSFSLSKTLQNGSSKTAVKKIKTQLFSFRKCSSFRFIEFSSV